MKPVRILLVCVCALIILFGNSCSVFGGAKSGCPSNGKNVGAERILSGDKVPKARKFKS